MATTTQELPPKEQYGPDADGIRTTVEYRYDDDGNVEKVTRRIKVVEEAGRVKKAIAQRREWKKFGAAFGIPHGTLEPGVIGLMDERHITTSGRDQTAAKPKATVVCRNCGDAHFTYQCPHKDKLGAIKDIAPKKEEPAEEARGAYVPLHKRAGAVPTQGTKMSTSHGTCMHVHGVRHPADDFSIRVSNLPEDVDEKKLQDLFSQCGRVSRFYLARNKTTNDLRGFAFVNYASRDDAENAIRRLNRTPFMHMILTVEWSKPQ